MVNEQNKPDPARTKSWKLPSLVRALMVMCVLGVVAGTGWHSWQWLQREVERNDILTELKILSPSELEAKAGAIIRMRVHSYVFPNPANTPSGDIEWTLCLSKADYDWYVVLLHLQGSNDSNARAIVGVSIFRFRPWSTDYQPKETAQNSPTSENLFPGFMSNQRQGPIPKQEWDYFMSFSHRLNSNGSALEFEAKLIHSSWTEGYKPDPRFDFEELVD